MLSSRPYHQPAWSVKLSGLQQTSLCHFIAVIPASYLPHILGHQLLQGAIEVMFFIGPEQTKGFLDVQAEQQLNNSSLPHSIASLRTNPPSLEVFAMHDLCRVITDAIQCTPGYSITGLIHGCKIPGK